MGHVRVGADNFYTPYCDTIEEAQLEQRCLEKQVGFEVIETVEGEGFYPERAKLLEDKYQASGKTDCLYTGLMTEDAQVSDNTAS